MKLAQPSRIVDVADDFDRAIAEIQLMVYKDTETAFITLLTHKNKTNKSNQISKRGKGKL